MSDKLSVAEIAEVTDTNQKSIRAYLRRNHTRSSEQKNSRWGDAKNAYVLSVKLTNELVSHFSKNDDNDDRKRTPSSDDGDCERIEREAIQREGNF